MNLAVLRSHHTIVLLLWLLSPYNWTVVWLNSLCICFGSAMLSRKLHPRGACV